MKKNRVKSDANIWSSRLIKEFDVIKKKGYPDGILLLNHDFHPMDLRCRAKYCLSLPNNRNENENENENKNKMTTINTEDDNENNNENNKNDNNNNNNDVNENNNNNVNNNNNNSNEQEEKGIEKKNKNHNNNNIDNENMVPKVEVIVELIFDSAIVHYPFEPPQIRVLSGSNHIPHKLLNGDMITFDDDNNDNNNLWMPSKPFIHLLIYLLKEMDIQLSKPNLYSINNIINMNNNFDGTIYKCDIIKKKKDGNNNNNNKDKDNMIIEKNCVLGITSYQIIQMKICLDKMNCTRVLQVNAINDIGKLRFRRGLSVTLLMKNDLMNPIEFHLQSNNNNNDDVVDDCVSCIKENLSKYGIQGRKTTTITQQNNNNRIITIEKPLDIATNMLQVISKLEENFSKAPSVQKVQEITDMYRQATEMAATATTTTTTTTTTTNKNDNNKNDYSEKVMSDLHSFLQREDVMNILDENAPMKLPKPKGEILKHNHLHNDSDDDDEFAREEQMLLGPGIQHLKDYMVTVLPPEKENDFINNKDKDKDKDKGNDIDKHDNNNNQEGLPMPPPKTPEKLQILCERIVKMDFDNNNNENDNNNRKKSEDSIDIQALERLTANAAKEFDNLTK